MSELHEECGVAAIYHLPGKGKSPLCPEQGPEEISRLMPRMLLDIQNRGQLAAGMTTYNPRRNQIIDTYKDVGSVNEVFRLSHRGKYEAIMREYAGRAAIGHVRYATCGTDDRSYAQPFERHHIKKHKWFSFAFNGQLANYMELREELLDDDDNHLARETDTEIFMHQICAALSTDDRPPLIDVCRHFARKFDGAYSLVFLDALGDMMVARDPLGIKPLCYAVEGPLFAAASESVALLNLGFAPERIKSVPPGHADHHYRRGTGTPAIRRQPAPRPLLLRVDLLRQRGQHARRASVYLSRKALGEELARLETLPIDSDTVVVPVPDTSKAAADAMAYALKIPCVEGLIRNRYSGRTFIEGSGDRKRKAETKYTPLGEVLEGKRVILVEDSIVRATTLARAFAADSATGPAQGNPRPRGLPAHYRTVFLRHRHVDGERTFRPEFSQGRADLTRRSRPKWRPSSAPIRSATCPSTPSPGPSAWTPIISAAPASPANIPPPAASIYRKSPWRTTATTSPAGRMKRQRKRHISCRVKPLR